MWQFWQANINRTATSISLPILPWKILQFCRVIFCIKTWFLSIKKHQLNLEFYTRNLYKKCEFRGVRKSYSSPYTEMSGIKLFLTCLATRSIMKLYYLAACRVTSLTPLYQKVEENSEILSWRASICCLLPQIWS